MVTGKDDHRIALAKRALLNFASQTYVNKHLLIINHHPSLRVLTTPDGENSRAREIHISKSKGLTLGDLRNCALDLVPAGALWTTWDDDDHRHPEYLRAMAGLRLRRGADVAALTNRLEYNSQNGECFASTKTDGFVFFLAPVSSDVRYDSVDTMEDLHILDDYRRSGYRVATWDNMHMMYIRLIHPDNTSLYAHPGKGTVLIRGLHYSERRCTPEERAYLCAWQRKNMIV